MRRIRLAGQLAEPISHYTDAVEASGLLCTSGMLPVNADGELVGTGDAVGVYVRDMADRELISTVRRRYFGDARPASTLVEVSALANPDALVEIEAVALLPRDDHEA